MNSMDKATQLTSDLRTGNAAAAEELLPLVYDHLYEMASWHFKRQRRDHTLQATALVHEAFLKMVNHPKAEYADESHFCSVAAMAMRQILIDHAAKRATSKRGGGLGKVELRDEDLPCMQNESCEDLIALDVALKQLAEHDDRKSRVVEMRYFGGLTMDQIACVLEVSLSTVESDWRMAKAWLSKELKD